MKLVHKLGLVAGTLLAPGFAQAVAGRRRAAIAWVAVLVAGTALLTLSIWIWLGALLLRLAALVSALFELRRFESPRRWWRPLSTTVFVVGLTSCALFRVQTEGFRIPTSSMYPTLQIGDRIVADKLSLMWRAPERGEVVVFRYPCDERIVYVKRVVAIGGDTVEVRCNILYVNGKAVPSTLIEDGKQCEYTDVADDNAPDGKRLIRSCSRYRETLGDHTYDLFHDPERPARDARRDTLASGDMRDFPQPGSPFAPSCRHNELFDAPVNGASQPAGTLVVTKPDAKACEPQLHYVVPAGGLFVMGDNRNNAVDSRVWGAVSTDAVIGRVMGIWFNEPPGGEPGWNRAGAIE